MALNGIGGPGTLPFLNGPGARGVESVGGGSGSEKPADALAGFGDMMIDGLGKVNGAVRDFEQVSQALANGERVNVHEMMVKGERADLSLRLMMSLRNKVVEAYQEVMRLQV